MRINHYLACFVSLLCWDSASAQGVGTTQLNTANRFFSTISAGADWIATGGSQTLTLLPPLTNSYIEHSTYKAVGSFGLGFGYERAALGSLLEQLGIAGYFDTALNKSGQVMQFSLPEFTNFNYAYHIQSSRVVATGKLLGSYRTLAHPYISGELGAAFNRSSTYKETPLIYEAVPMAPFQNNSKTSFTWGVGAGVDVDVHEYIRLGAGYQFADLGKAQLGPSPASYTAESLAISHLYSHQLRLQLTALI